VVPTTYLPAIITEQPIDQHRLDSAAGVKPRLCAGLSQKLRRTNGVDETPGRAASRGRSRLCLRQKGVNFPFNAAIYSVQRTKY